ncbi:MAG TPA: hypothetical protein VFQ79_02640 [Bryobacteraceae bacterium]|nr:hypothetical protein [Bryobacteraceae bacterium]
MSLKRKSRLISIAGVCFLATLAVPLSFAQTYESARTVVQRTQDDLEQVRRQRPRNDKERERIDNARKSLSDFDRSLSRNKFDKDRLDRAIEDVKNIVEKNTLQARDRDALSTDLADLRKVRSTRGR